MFKKIMEFYNSRKASERVLMICTIYMLLFVWFFSVQGSTRECANEIEVRDNEISKLEGYLSLRPKIMANLAEVKRNLDEKKMIDAQGLQLCIEQCALLSGVEYDMSSTSESKLDNFQMFSINLNVKKAELSNLVELEKMLIAYAPYIRVNSASVSSSKKTIGASYKISSFIVK